MKNKHIKSDTIICRCEDITLEEIEAAVDAGLTDPEELKRFLHVGMGPCQGRTCGRLVSRIIAQKTGTPMSKVRCTSQRPPLISVPIRELVGGGDE